MPPPDPNREAKIAEAIQAVHNQAPGCESISKAARFYLIPQETLRRRFHGITRPISANGGQNRLLDETQEQALISYLRRSTELGFPLRNDMVADAAQSLLRNAGSDAKVGHNWPSRFLSRYPEFSVLKQSAAARQPAAERAQALEDKIEETEQKISEADLEALRSKAMRAQLKADRAILRSLKATEKALKTRAKVVEAETSLSYQARATPGEPHTNIDAIRGQAVVQDALGEQHAHHAASNMSIVLDEWS